MISALKAKFKEKHSKAVKSSGWVGRRSGVVKESPPESGAGGTERVSPQAIPGRGHRVCGPRGCSRFCLGGGLKEIHAAAWERAGEPQGAGGRRTTQDPVGQRRDGPQSNSQRKPWGSAITPGGRQLQASVAPAACCSGFSWNTHTTVNRFQQSCLTSSVMIQRNPHVNSQSPHSGVCNVHSTMQHGPQTNGLTQWLLATQYFDHRLSAPFHSFL